MKTVARLDIPRRMRRLRLSSSVRDLVEEVQINADDLIGALFVQDGEGEPQPIASMPGVFRLSRNSIVDECQRLRDSGVKAVAIFPCLGPELRDTDGTQALNPDGLMPAVISRVKAKVRDLVIITDVALDPYTIHGHDGVLDPATGQVDNDRTVEILTRMAVLEAQAGADWVAPSDMMDGRVKAIRHGLDTAGFTQTSILSYAAKFASAYYGPFRDAIGSKPAAGQGYLDKTTYQLNPANPREALREALLDEAEGADLLMVKPAGPYLDVIRELRQRTLLPLVAYQVSGEYAQIQAAARLGWLDLERTRNESLLAIKRAGADLIITYFAREMAQWLAKRGK